MRRALFLSFMCILVITVHVAAGEIAVDFAHPKFARLDADGKKLVSEYAKTYPKIKEFYDNMRMDVTVKTMDVLSEKSLQTLKKIGESRGLNEMEYKELIERASHTEKLYEMRHRVSEKYSRIDRKQNHPVTPSVRAKLPHELSQLDYLQESVITLLTPTMGYQLSRNDPRNQYFSLNVKQDFTKSNNGGVEIEVLYFDGAAFSSEATPLEEILFQCPPAIDGVPYRVVEYVQQKEIAGEQVVEIRLVSSRHLDSNPDNIHGIIRLYRDSWVVKDAFSRTQIVSPGKYFGEIGWIRTSCTYDGELNGVPIMRTYQRYSGDFDKETQEEKLARQIHCEVTKLVPGPPDLSEFDVAQFLPPGAEIGK